MRQRASERVRHFMIYGLGRHSFPEHDTAYVRATRRQHRDAIQFSVADEGPAKAGARIRAAASEHLNKYDVCLSTSSWHAFATVGIVWTFSIEIHTHFPSSYSIMKSCRGRAAPLREKERKRMRMTRGEKLTD